MLKQEKGITRTKVIQFQEIGYKFNLESYSRKFMTWLHWASAIFSKPTSTSGSGPLPSKLRKGSLFQYIIRQSFTHFSNLVSLIERARDKWGCVFVCSYKLWGRVICDNMCVYLCAIQLKWSIKSIIFLWILTIFFKILKNIACTLYLPYFQINITV